MLLHSHAILFVADQDSAAAFYAAVFGLQPALNVPGMTEFELTTGLTLGLMPIEGARRLLDTSIERGKATGELYFIVTDPEKYHARALSGGAAELSPFGLRDWGDSAAYSQTPDGHILAFARRAE